jgi:hypothetical protein
MQTRTVMAQSVHLECCLRGKVKDTLTTLRTSSNLIDLHKAAFLRSSLHKSLRRIRGELELSHTFYRTSRCALRSQSSSFIRQPLRQLHDRKKNKDPCRSVQRKSSNGGPASSDDSKKVGPAQSKTTHFTFIQKSYQICKPLFGASPEDLPVSIRLVPQHCYQPLKNLIYHPIQLLLSFCPSFIENYLVLLPHQLA